MSKLTDFARNQRKNKNPWEIKLWQHLRSHRMCGVQFKRQVPFGNLYIADFCSHVILLVIELDGGQHAQKEISEKDTLKEAYLISKGYRVLRFWNNDLDNNMEGVLETIRRAVTAPPPRPSPLAASDFV